MKVLFLAKDVLDFHQDMVCHGLAEVLGPENVFVWPHVERYHELPPDDLQHVAMSYPNLPRREDAPLDDLATEADVVIVGCLRGTGLDGLRAVIDLGVDKPRAALDGLDDYYVRAAIRDVHLYFKRETLTRSTKLRLKFPLRKVYYSVRPHDMWRNPLRRQVAVARLGVDKLLPLPFAVVPTAFPAAPARTHDITFLGSATHPLRAKLVEQLRDLETEGLDIRIPDDPLTEKDRYRFDLRLSWTQYMEELSASRVALSVRGNGFDTYRYWEIPYAGSALLAETPRTVIPNNFVDGAEAVFAEPRDLPHAARRLARSDEAEQIAAAGHEKLLSAHLSRHRAETVLERLESLVGRSRS